MARRFGGQPVITEGAGPLLGPAPTDIQRHVFDQELQRAVQAHEKQSGYRSHGSRSAADVLDERCGPFDWSSFGSRGYELLREEGERAGFNGRNTPTPDEANPSGGEYEKRYEPARRRLSRASA